MESLESRLQRKGYFTPVFVQFAFCSEQSESVSRLSTGGTSCEEKFHEILTSSKVFAFESIVGRIVLNWPIGYLFSIYADVESLKVVWPALINFLQIDACSID